MGSVGPRLLKRAAKEIAAQLRERRIDGVVAIARHPSGPEIIVYVRQLTPLLRKHVPATWNGVPVTLRKTGSILPA